MYLPKHIYTTFLMCMIRLYPASIKTYRGQKWGYIDSTGNFIIKPKYEDALDFQKNGLAIVRKGEFFGVINKCGRYLIKPKYSSISEFREGLAEVLDKDGFKVVNDKGDEVTSKAYDYIGTYQEGRAVFGTTNKDGEYAYGYLDRWGKEIIKPKYKSASDFKDGKAVVKIKDGEYFLIGLNGQILNSYNYAFVGNLGEGLLAFKEKEDGKYGYIDYRGNVIIPAQYTEATAFTDNRAVVNISDNYIVNKYGLIDRVGNFLINPKYNDIKLLKEDRVAVGVVICKDKPYIGSKYAIADTKGNFFTNFIYYDVRDYKKGISSAYDAKSTFFIDKWGRRIQNLPRVKGSGTLYFDNNIIKADVDYRVFYLDICGNVIWHQNRIIPLDNNYMILEKKYRPNRDYLVYYPKIIGIKDKSVENSVNKELMELSKIKYIPENVQLDYNYFGDFSIQFFKKDLLVLELNGYKYYYGAAHGMPSKIYPHINLVSGQFYTLKDLFKENSDYVKIISDIIKYKIKNEDEYSYVFPDAFTKISSNQPFYVDEEALYIYFYPYEIAPYVAGFPTFTIPYSDIINIIDREGDFWRAFN